MYSQEILKPNARQNNAVNLVVMDMTYPDGEFAGKTVVATCAEIEEKINFCAGNNYEIGMILADTIANLPSELSEWEKYGFNCMPEDPTPSHIAGRAIIAFASTSPEIAKAFVQNLTPDEITKIDGHTIACGILDAICNERFNSGAIDTLYYGLSSPNPEFDNSANRILEFLDTNITDNPIYVQKFRDFMNSAQLDNRIGPETKETIGKIIFRDEMEQYNISETIRETENLIVDLEILDLGSLIGRNEAIAKAEVGIKNLIKIRREEPVHSRMLELRLRRLYAENFYPKNNKLNQIAERIDIFEEIASLDEDYIQQTSENVIKMLISETRQIMMRIGQLSFRQLEIMRNVCYKLHDISRSDTEDPKWIDNDINNELSRRRKIDSTYQKLGINKKFNTVPCGFFEDADNFLLTNQQAYNELKKTGKLPKFTLEYRYASTEEEAEKLYKIDINNGKSHAGIDHNFADSFGLFLQILGKSSNPAKISDALARAKFSFVYAASDHGPKATIAQKMVIKLDGVSYQIDVVSATDQQSDLRGPISSGQPDMPNVASAITKENLGIYFKDYRVSFTILSNKFSSNEKATILKRMQIFSNPTI